MTFTVRVGAHNDLVLAAAIALWWAESRRRSERMVHKFDGTLADKAINPNAYLRQMRRVRQA
jgi:hypothetical protein